MCREFSVIFRRYGTSTALITIVGFDRTNARGKLKLRTSKSPSKGKSKCPTLEVHRKSRQESKRLLAPAGRPRRPSPHDIPHMSSSSGGGEGEEESAAVVEFAFGADGAAVGEHDVLGDGEAESGAAGFAGAGLVDAVKALEEARKMLGRNAGAEILNIKFNPEFDAAFGGTRAEQNTSARAAVLHGVVDKIRKVVPAAWRYARWEPAPAGCAPPAARGSRTWRANPCHARCPGPRWVPLMDNIPSWRSPGFQRRRHYAPHRARPSGPIAV